MYGREKYILTGLELDLLNDKYVDKPLPYFLLLMK